MLLFKPKPKEILPPPPPYSESQQPEIEEGPIKKHKFFDEVLKPDKLKTETFPEEEEFGELVKELDENIKPKKTGRKIISAKKEPKTKKIQKTKQIKLKKTIQVQLKKKTTPKTEKVVNIKQPKYGKSSFKKIKTAEKVKKQEAPDLGEDFDLKGIDFGLPKELEPSEKELEMPETLGEFGFESEKTELERETQKPQEILEAEEEIKTAIEKIKRQEKPSFFKKLFGGKEKKEERFAEQKAEEQPMQEFQETDNLSKIQNNISKARDALMKFDLEGARKSYIEAMMVYNNLKPEEQAKVYHDIRELYSERKSAEELKV